MEKTGRKREFGECSYRWEDNVNIYVFKEKNGVVDCVTMSLAGAKRQDVVNTKIYFIFQKVTGRIFINL